MAINYRLTIASHHFTVSEMSPRVREQVVKFTVQFIQFVKQKRNGYWVNVPYKVFAAAPKDHSEFRFHINVLERFREHMARFLPGVTGEEVNLAVKRHEPVEIPIKEGYAPFEKQLPIIDFVAKEDGPASRLVEFETGGGKTMCSLFVANRRKTRTTYFMRPGFINRWLDEIRDKTQVDVDSGEVLTVEGSKELLGYLNMVADGTCQAKIVLISNRTFQRYLDLYEEHKEKILEMGYPCVPADFFEFTQSNFKNTDEVHLDFHLNFKIDLYTHTDVSMAMTGTYLSDDSFIQSMMNIAYPAHTRIQGESGPAHVAVKTLFYQFQEPEKIQYKNWANGNYSHIVLESCIMRSKKMLANYTRLIGDCIQIYYLNKDDYRPGDKCILFCASVEFASYITDELKKRFPQLSIKRYVGSLNDPYTNLIEPDLRISTHQSAGTAHDIPQLTTTIMSMALRSSAGSIQNLGRLRRLKDGRTPVNVFLTSPDIDRHMDYHEHREKLMKHRVISFTTAYNDYVI